MFNLSQDYFVFSSLIFVVVTVFLYALERWSIVFKSIFILAFLMLFFSIFPYIDESGKNALSPDELLKGFANTSLISVICLLILGQGVVRTKVLDKLLNKIVNFFPNQPNLVFIIALIFVLFLSAFLNNTPVVIIFIPILQGLAIKIGMSVSKYMMPLSFAAILGGMTTLIGSSTNLLVANSLYELSNIRINFFEFIIPGLILAICGLIYVIIFSKFLLKDNAPMSSELLDGSGKQFVIQLSIPHHSNLIGQKANKDLFEDFDNISILMIQRKEHAEFGPFNDFVLKKNDLLVITTTRESLSDMFSKKIQVEISDTSLLKDINEKDESNQILTEAMVTPSSSLVGQTIENVSFRYRFECVVIGLQRKARMIRNRMTEIALETGDILLIQGTKNSIKNLRDHSDIMAMEWASSEIVKNELAMKSLIIFLSVILLSALNILPLVTASLLGVFAMRISNVLSIRQIIRSVDNNLLMLVVSSLAIGTVIQETGTASYLSEKLYNLLSGLSPKLILTFFFIFVSLATNLISNNACAILFTPIAMDLSEKVGIDPKIFAISLIFAVNTSFLSPMAYQTNLIVMGPGHYKFLDYLKFGFPLTVILWITFFLFFPWYYNL